MATKFRRILANQFYWGAGSEFLMLNFYMMLNSTVLLSSMFVLGHCGVALLQNLHTPQSMRGDSSTDEQKEQHNSRPEESDRDTDSSLKMFDSRQQETSSEQEGGARSRRRRAKSTL